MLSLAVTRQIEELEKLLESYRIKNRTRNSYYTGVNRLKDLGISIPDEITNLKAGVAFPSIVIDSIEERINLQGFYSDEYDLEDIFFENNLQAESSMVHIDALEYGTSYLVIGRGGPGEPEILITPESPNSMVGIRNLRTRRLEVACDIKSVSGGRESIGTLYLPDVTIPFAITEDGSIVEDGEPDYHNLGFVPVVQFINRPQTSNRNGRSEITEVVMALTDSAVRTYVGMEVARELYGNPKSVFSNVNMAEFRGPDGRPRNPFSTRANQAIILGKGDNATTSASGSGGGSAPTVSQLSAGNPSSFVPLLDKYAAEVSAHSGIPIHRFGTEAVQFPSGDALTAMDQPLISKAERRISNFGRTWEEAMRIAITIRDGKAPGMRSIEAIFRKPETPTRAADTDATVKLVQADIYSADSELTLAGLNLSVHEQNLWRREKTATRSTNLIRDLALAKGPLPAPVAEDLQK